MKSDLVQSETTPLLATSSQTDDTSTSSTGGDGPTQYVAIPNWQLAGLYATHTLSMWNSRSYEFAAVLFTTSAYPHTLTVASLRGLSANLASLLFAPAVGRWCNRHASRLRPLQLCIVFQGVCIAAACLGWTLIVQRDGYHHDAARRDRNEGVELQPTWLKPAIISAVIVLGMLERLSWVGNVAIIERDWVPLLAHDTTRPALHILNANVKRIDLITKLVAPLAVSAFVIWSKDLIASALIIAALQATVIPGVIMASRVWHSSTALQSEKDIHNDIDVNSETAHPIKSLTKKFTTWFDLLRSYSSSSVFLPSISWALQPASVLTLSASMMVYLLSIDFPLEQITLARTLSTGVEISSTILTPLLISFLRRRQKQPSRSGDRTHHLKPLIFVGLLGLSWQLLMLIPAVTSLLILPTLPTDPTKAFPILTKILLISLGLSRLGPFAYALVEQQLVQVAVAPSKRVEFTGTEMALLSLSELCRWGLTGVFGKPEQFKGVACGSFATIGIAAGLFWWWTWRWRERLSKGEVAGEAANEAEVEPENMEAERERLLE